MRKRSKTKGPATLTYQPEPKRGSIEWLIWAAWADRVSFEYIHEQTGLTEADVIKLMRTHQSPSTFRRWRKRVSGRRTKHRYRFVRSRHSRQAETQGIDEFINAHEHLPRRHSEDKHTT